MIEQTLVRAGTAAEWADTDATDGEGAPVLAAGELAVVTDTGEIRVGDGVHAFASLSGRVAAKKRGNLTLVAGTKNLTGLTGVAVGDIVIATVRTLGTVTAPKALVAVAGVDQITVTSSDNTDTSVINYVVFPQ